MNLFLYSDYKEYLKSLINNNQSKKGFQSQLARAAQCQKSYFSKTLNGELQLTPDHAYGITQFLELDELEADYFIEMVNLQRAAKASLQNFIKRKLNKIKQQSMNLKGKLSVDEIDEEHRAYYYSSWYIPAIHILISIPHYNSIEKISKRLGISAELTTKTIDNLVSMKLLEKTDDFFVLTQRHIHLDNNANAINSHHSHWRHRAMFDVSLGRAENLHYSVIQSMSHEDFYKFQNDLKKLIAKHNKMVNGSKEEELVCFNLDYFIV